MAEIQPSWDAIEPMTTVRPRNPDELIEALELLTGLASQWSDLLDGLRDATRRYGGPGAAASFDIACRRSEQALIELQIAHRDALAYGS